MGHTCEALHGFKPVMLMVLVLYKMVANDGMNLRILIAYRVMLAAAFPLALIFKRSLLLFICIHVIFFLTQSLTSVSNILLHLLACIRICFYLSYRVPLLMSTIDLDYYFRLEKLRLMTITGKARVLGTFIEVVGAMTFYKGVEIHIWTTHFKLLPPSQHQNFH
ncbi:LOW QUALITY PROTEIN: hypothetical protein CFOL_v3_10868, partial [Cephalotus follicularis]